MISMGGTESSTKIFIAIMFWEIKIWKIIETLWTLFLHMEKFSHCWNLPCSYVYLLKWSRMNCLPYSWSGSFGVFYKDMHNSFQLMKIECLMNPQSQFSTLSENFFIVLVANFFLFLYWVQFFKYWVSLFSIFYSK